MVLRYDATGLEIEGYADGVSLDRPRLDRDELRWLVLCAGPAFLTSDSAERVSDHE